MPDIDSCYLTVVRVCSVLSLVPHVAGRPTVEMSLSGALSSCELRLGKDGQNSNLNWFIEFQDITPDSTLNVRVWYKTKQEREDQLVAWGTATFTEIYQRRSSTSFESFIDLVCLNSQIAYGPDASSGLPILTIRFSALPVPGVILRPSIRGPPRSTGSHILRDSLLVRRRPSQRQRRENEEAAHPANATGHPRSRHVSDSPRASISALSPQFTLAPDPDNVCVPGLSAVALPSPVICPSTSTGRSSGEIISNAYPFGYPWYVRHFGAPTSSTRSYTPPTTPPPSLYRYMAPLVDVDEESTSDDGPSGAVMPGGLVMDTLDIGDGTATPRHSTIMESVLSKITPYEELCDPGCAFGEVRNGLLQEWLFIGGGLVAFAGIFVTILGLSGPSFIIVNSTAMSAVEVGCATAVIGVVVDGAFVARYSHLNDNKFKDAVRGIDGTYFFFCLSCKLPMLCLLVSLLALIVFLVAVCWAMFPTAVAVVCLLVVLILTWQYFVYIYHEARSRITLLKGRVSIILRSMLSYIPRGRAIDRNIT